MTLLPLIFAAYGAFGFGAAALMVVLLDVAVMRVSSKELLTSIFKVLGWFFGNGAVALGILSIFDLDKLLLLAHANGVAVVGYVSGFGLTSGLLALRRKPEIFDLLRDVLNNRELEVLLLMMRYRCSADDAANRLSMTKAEAEQLFEDAIRHLRDRGERVFHALSSSQAEMSLRNHDSQDKHEIIAANGQNPTLAIAIESVPKVRPLEANRSA